jgi:GTP-binding protein
MTEQEQGVKISEAEFLFGAPDAQRIRKQPLPEVAVAGRSNVGKSTFLNRLMGRRAARVSGTPGCTRELNFFKVQGSLRDEAFSLALVDMPGFGYAKLSKYEREAIARMAVEYIETRRQLRVVLLLTDIRRAPQEDEYAVQRLCGENERHCLIVATKVDTLKRSEQERALAAVARAYKLEPQDLLVTGEGVSVAPIWERVGLLISSL